MAELHPAAPLIEGIPANKLLGLVVTEMGEGAAAVSLPWRDEVANHVGTVHAAALFAIADATSGAAVMSGLADLAGRVTPIASGGEIRYTKPARGPITGRAALSADALATMRSELDDVGVSRPTVVVELVDADGTAVAEASFHWHIRRRER